MAAELYLSKIDELTRGDHSHLTATDNCWFIREYTSHAGYAHSDTTGAHFRAAAALITQALPGVPIVGLFVARRVFPDSGE